MNLILESQREIVAEMENCERELDECRENLQSLIKRLREEDKRRQTLQQELDGWKARCERLKEELCANCEYRKPFEQSTDVATRIEDMLSKCRDEMRLAIEASLGERLEWLDLVKNHFEKIVRWSERARKWIEEDAKATIARELEARLKSDDLVRCTRKLLELREVAVQDEFEGLLKEAIWDVLDKFMIPKTVFEP